MNEGYERELAALRRALELPTVSHPCREAELAGLRRLIATYVDEARQVIGEVGEPPN